MTSRSSTIRRVAPHSLFWLLTADEQRERIRRLAAAGLSDATISTATGWRLQDVRRVVGGLV
jgi:hypothetical protein